MWTVMERWVAVIWIATILVLLVQAWSPVRRRHEIRSAVALSGDRLAGMPPQLFHISALFFLPALMLLLPLAQVLLMGSEHAIPHRVGRAGFVLCAIAVWGQARNRQAFMKLLN